MKNLKISILVLVFLMVFIPKAFAQLYAIEPYIMPPSLEIKGMGGAYVAITDNKNVIFHNPAGLASYDRFTMSILHIGIDIGDVSNPLIKDTILGGSYFNVFNVPFLIETFSNIEDMIDIENLDIDSALRAKIGLGLPLVNDLGVIFRRFGIKTFSYSNVDLALNKKGFLADVNMRAYVDVGLAMGYGTTILDSFIFDSSLDVGINLKYLIRALAAKDGLSSAMALGFMGDFNESMNDAMALAKAGQGIGSDIGVIWSLNKFLFFDKVNIGATLTDWFGTRINYSNFDTDAMFIGEPEEILRGIIPPTLNIGASANIQKLPFIPRWILGDAVLSMDIRELIVVKFDNLPSYKTALFRNIYFGGQIKFLDIPYLRNWFLLPLKISAGVHQGNLFSLSVEGKLLRMFSLGFGIWREERGEKIGQDSLTKMSVSLQFGFGI